MLRFSKKADYALIALKDLAARAEGETSASAREIAARYDIPAQLMAKVLQRLAKMGVVVSLQGTRGGYQLARPANQISVGDVIQAIDGPVLVVACSDEDETCEQYAKCNVRDPLRRLRDRIAQSLAAFTVDELAADTDAAEPLPVTLKRRPADLSELDGG